VSPDKQFYHCFGLRQARYGCSASSWITITWRFPEAVEELAHAPWAWKSRHEGGVRQQRPARPMSRCSKLMARVAAFYAQGPWARRDGAPPRDYLAQTWTGTRDHRALSVLATRRNSWNEVVTGASAPPTPTASASPTPA